MAKIATKADKIVNYGWWLALKDLGDPSESDALDYIGKMTDAEIDAAISGPIKKVKFRC